MSADDWAARLVAADAAVLSCFVVVIFILGLNTLDIHLPVSPSPSELTFCPLSPSTSC